MNRFLAKTGIWNRDFGQSVFHLPSLYMEHKGTRICILSILGIMLVINASIIANVSFDTLMTVISICMGLLAVLVLVLIKINLYVNFPYIYPFRFILFMILLAWIMYPYFMLLYNRSNVDQATINNAWVSVIVSSIIIIWTISSWVKGFVPDPDYKSNLRSIVADDKCSMLKGWDDYGFVSLKFDRENNDEDEIVKMCDKFTGKMYHYDINKNTFVPSTKS